MEKIKQIVSLVVNSFIGFLCFLFNILICLFIVNDHNISGGLGFPGIVGFLIWIILMIIFLKISPKISLGVGYIIYLILAIKCGDSKLAANMIVVTIITVALFLYIRHRMK